MSIFESWNSNLTGAQTGSTSSTSSQQASTKCYDNNTCASGYACVGGQCVRTTGSGGGTGGIYGSLDIGGGITLPGGPCGSGTDGYSPGGLSGSCASPSSAITPQLGCTVATCGDGFNGYGSDDTDCCGEKCCFFSGGNLVCVCGPCSGDLGEQECRQNSDCESGICQNGRCVGQCSEFCHSYYLNTGTMTAGCGSYNICSSCADCEDQRCNKKTSDLPCHCKTDQLGPCDLCANDGSIIENAGCTACCELKSYECDCGIKVTAKACLAQGTTDSACSTANQKAKELCAEECKQDPCTPEPVRKTICDTGRCPYNSELLVPENEPGFRNVWAACIEDNQAGPEDFKYCVIYDEYDLTSTPDECTKAKCNCDLECPEDQLCTQYGKCA